MQDENNHNKLLACINFISLVFKLEHITTANAAAATSATVAGGNVQQQHDDKVTLTWLLDNTDGLLLLY